MNVIDKYKGWEVDLIKRDIQKKTFPVGVCMINFEYDFNFGTLVRNCNAFGVKDVFYLSDKKKWDKRSAVGTYNYTDVTYLQTNEQLFSLLRKFNSFSKHYRSIVAIENTEDSVPLSTFEWPENPLIIFGSENMGINPGILNECDKIVKIPMIGSVRSLNVGTASGIVLHDYMVKNEILY